MLSIFGSRLRELRAEMGETQEDIAKILGKSIGAISKYEMGERQPGLDDIANLVKYFNTTSDYMLGLSNVRLNVENIGENIRIIMSGRSADKFVADVAEKTGKQIVAEKMESYAAGKSLPTVEDLKALAAFAGVEPSFFLKNPEKVMNKEYSCKEMEELDRFEKTQLFKRVLRLAINILRYQLDVEPFEKFVQSMVQLKGADPE